MKAYLAPLVSLFVLSTSCTTVQNPDETQSASDLNTINLELPSKDGLAQEVAAKLTNYRLTIEAQKPFTGAALAPAGDSNNDFERCSSIPVNSGAVSEVVQGGLRRTGDYNTSATLAAKIHSQCTYIVKLEVGNQGAAEADKPATDASADAKKPATDTAAAAKPNRQNPPAAALRDELGFDTYYVGEKTVSTYDAVYAADGSIQVEITLNLAKDKAEGAEGENFPGSLIPADKDLVVKAKFGQGVEGGDQQVAP